MLPDPPMARALGLPRWTLAFVLLAGCGSDTEPQPATPSPTMTPPARPAVAPISSTTTNASPSTTMRPVTTPEDARRLLEERGIDPDRLSEEVGEQMRRRFQPDSPRN